jgi:hypothetical protein
MWRRQNRGLSARSAKRSLCCGNGYSCHSWLLLQFLGQLFAKWFPLTLHEGVASMSPVKIRQRDARIANIEGAHGKDTQSSVSSRWIGHPVPSGYEGTAERDARARG